MSPLKNLARKGLSFICINPLSRYNVTMLQAGVWISAMKGFKSLQCYNVVDWCMDISNKGLDERGVNKYSHTVVNNINGSNNNDNNRQLRSNMCNREWPILFLVDDYFYGHMNWLCCVLVWDSWEWN